MKYVVRFTSSDSEVEIDEKESLLEALQAKGIYIKSSCGGVASCGDCIVKVIEGKESLNEVTFSEEKLLGNVYHITKERLSCQSYITGDIRIDISHHDKAGDEKKRQKKNFQKSNQKVIRRKKEDLAAPEKSKQDQDWFRHWEKKETPKRPGKGGMKRPKAFKDPKK